MRIHLRDASDDSILYTWGDNIQNDRIGSNNANGWQNQVLDVTAFAGTDVYLELQDNQPSGGGWVGLTGGLLWGDVTFTAVPEPSTLILASLGLVGLGLVTGRRRRRA